MFGNKGKNNGALDWLLKRGFRTEKVTFGKFGDIKRKTHWNANFRWESRL